MRAIGVGWMRGFEMVLETGTLAPEGHIRDLERLPVTDMRATDTPVVEALVLRYCDAVHCLEDSVIADRGTVNAEGGPGLAFGIHPRVHETCDPLGWQLKHEYQRLTREFGLAQAMAGIMHPIQVHGSDDLGLLVIHCLLLFTIDGNSVPSRWAVLCLVGTALPGTRSRISRRIAARPDLPLPGGAKPRQSNSSM